MLTIGEQICCPKPCASNFIYKNGQCYARNRIGDDCEIDEQCANGQGASCVNGTCKCAKGWLTRHGSCMRMSYKDTFEISLLKDI